MVTIGVRSIKSSYQGSLIALSIFTKFKLLKIVQCCILIKNIEENKSEKDKLKIFPRKIRKSDSIFSTTAEKY